MRSSLQTILNAKKNDMFSHAYIFYSYPLVDVNEAVFEAIKIIISTKDNDYKNIKKLEDLKYPDLHIIEAHNKLITKDELVQQVKNMMNSALIVNNKKILFLKDVDKTQISNLNTLLKYIEDPADNTIILMSTNYIDKVLSTIKSRAQNIFVQKEKPEEQIKKMIEKDSKYEKYAYQLINTFKNFADIEQNYEDFVKIYDGFVENLKSNSKNMNAFIIFLSEKITKYNYLIYLKLLENFVIEIINFGQAKYFESIKTILFVFSKKKINSNNLLVNISNFRKVVLANGNFALQLNVFLNKLLKELNV